MLNGLADTHVRTLYRLAKEEWNHAWWNAFYHRILCYSHYSQRALDIGGSAKVVGNPRFDEWHNRTYDTALPNSLKLNAKKQTILYAPTYGALSSLPHWAEQLSRLSHEYNVVTKLHHGTQHRPEEAASLALAQRYLKNRLDDPQHLLALIAQADYVLTDSSGFIFDAIHMNKRVILLSWPEMTSLLDGQQSSRPPIAQISVSVTSFRWPRIYRAYATHSLASLTGLRWKRHWLRFATTIAMRLWMVRRGNGRRWRSRGW